MTRIINNAKCNCILNEHNKFVKCSPNVKDWKCIINEKDCVGIINEKNCVCILMRKSTHVKRNVTHII